MNVAEVAPAATVTLEEITALELLDDSLMDVPPDGAGEPRVTVPTAVEPLTTVVGATARDFNQPATKRGF